MKKKLTPTEKRAANLVEKRIAAAAGWTITPALGGAKTI